MEASDDEKARAWLDGQGFAISLADKADDDPEGGDDHMIAPLSALLTETHAEGERAGAERERAAVVAWLLAWMARETRACQRNIDGGSRNGKAMNRGAISILTQLRAGLRALDSGEHHVCTAGNRPAQMDAPDGPVCGCGKPSRHESGWCGLPRKAGEST